MRHAEQATFSRTGENPCGVLILLVFELGNFLNSLLELQFVFIQLFFWDYRSVKFSAISDLFKFGFEIFQICEVGRN